MRKASFPTERMYSCQSCVKTLQSNHQQQVDVTKPAVDTTSHTTQEVSAKPPQKRPFTTIQRKERKIKIPKLYNDIFSDQDGGKLEMVSPVMAAVDQAKALISRRRRCRRKKACAQKGARVIQKVYNRKGVRSRKRTKKGRRHGAK